MITWDTKETTKVVKDGEITEIVEYFPARLRWSSYLLPEEFRVSLFTNASYIDLLGDSIRARILNVLPLRDIFVAYKENSIHNISPGGLLFSEVDVMTEERGLLGPKGVTQVHDNQHFFVDHSNFYLYNGYEFYTALADGDSIGNRIKDYFYDNFDFSKKDSLYVQAIPHRSECWIFFTTEAGRREAICWNWEFDSWTRMENLALRCMQPVKSFGNRSAIYGGNQGSGDERGLVKVFGIQRNEGGTKQQYTRDGVNTGARRQPENIRGIVEFPTIPFYEKENRGSDPRMHPYTIFSLLADMNLGFEDSQEPSREDIDNMNGEDATCKVFLRHTDNITVEPKKEENPFYFEHVRDGTGNINVPQPSRLKLNPFSSQDNPSPSPKQYVGLRLEFSAPDFLEELGTIVQTCEVEKSLDP